MDTLISVLHKLVDLIPWPPTLNVDQKALLHEQIDDLAVEVVKDVVAQLETK